MAKKLLDPIPPGEILLEEFMRPLGISINALGRGIDVSPNRVSAIVNAKRSITADTALQLGKFFKVSPEIGSGFNPITICAWRNAAYGRRLKAASTPMQRKNNRNSQTRQRPPTDTPSHRDFSRP